MKIGDLVVNTETGSYAIVIDYSCGNSYRETLVKVLPGYSQRSWTPAQGYKTVNK